MNRAQRRANPGTGNAPRHDPKFEAKAQEFKDHFQQAILEKLTGDDAQSAPATDPDLLAVLREIRDNTGRIARVLEGHT